MKQKVKHTSPPWKFDGKSTGVIFEGATGYTIATVHFAKGRAISNINFNRISMENAAFIVRAVNSHDMLVDALESVLEDTQHGELLTVGKLVQARISLKLAKGTWNRSER